VGVKKEEGGKRNRGGGEKERVAKGHTPIDCVEEKKNVFSGWGNTLKGERKGRDEFQTIGGKRQGVKKKRDKKKLSGKEA